MPPRSLIAAVLIGAAVLLTGCDGEADSTPSTLPPATTVTPDDTTPSTTATTTVPPATIPGVDPEVEEQLRLEIAELTDVTEDVRGLPFIEEPDLAILAPEDFARRVADDLAEDLDPADLAIDEQFLEMMGLLDGTVDYRGLLIDLYEEQALGFYDGRTGELVVAGDVGELTPLRRAVIVHELVHALTDQHFEYFALLEQLIDEGLDDEALALRTLVEGDAIYYQLVYAQSLSETERMDLAAEQATLDGRVFATSPGFVQESLLFPYEEGFAFVSELVGAGGADAVNRAYRNPPTMTEAVLHPERYVRSEAARFVDPSPIALPGFTTAEAGVFGEAAIRFLLHDAVSRGEVTQAADGWGGDWYEILTDADDVIFVWEYLGDSERDAVELVQALVTVAEERMNGGEAGADSGGLSFATDDVYVFIDRVDDRVFYVASTDPALGDDVRQQLQS